MSVFPKWVAWMCRNRNGNLIAPIYRKDVQRGAAQSGPTFPTFQISESIMNISTVIPFSVKKGNKKNEIGNFSSSKLHTNNFQEELLIFWRLLSGQRKDCPFSINTGTLWILVHCQAY